MAYGQNAPSCDPITIQLATTILHSITNVMPNAIDIHNQPLNKYSRYLNLHTK